MEWYKRNWKSWCLCTGCWHWILKGPPATAHLIAKITQWTAKTNCVARTSDEGDKGRNGCVTELPGYPSVSDLRCWTEKAITILWQVWRVLYSISTLQSWNNTRNFQREGATVARHYVSDSATMKTLSRWSITWRTCFPRAIDIYISYLTPSISIVHMHISLKWNIYIGACTYVHKLYFIYLLWIIIIACSVLDGRWWYNISVHDWSQTIRIHFGILILTSGSHVGSIADDPSFRCPSPFQMMPDWNVDNSPIHCHKQVIYFRQSWLTVTISGYFATRDFYSIFHFCIFILQLRYKTVTRPISFYSSHYYLWTYIRYFKNNVVSSIFLLK